MNCFSCFYFHEKKKTPRGSDNSGRRNGELTGRDNNKTHPGKLFKSILILQICLIHILGFIS